MKGRHDVVWRRTMLQFIVNTWDIRIVQQISAEGM